MVSLQSRARTRGNNAMQLISKSLCESGAIPGEFAFVAYNPSSHAFLGMPARVSEMSAGGPGK